MTERDGKGTGVAKRVRRKARWPLRRRRAASRNEAVWRWGSGDHRKASACPYRRRRALLSRGELAFYHALLPAVRDRWTINVKPRLADVIWCPPSLWNTPAGARISQKHLDFVLYDRETTAVLLAIELDDRSHARGERQARDAFVDAVLDVCGVVLLRVPAAARYDSEVLRMLVEARVGRRVRRRPGRAHAAVPRQRWEGA
jgi:hypothetical protein